MVWGFSLLFILSHEEKSGPGFYHVLLKDLASLPGNPLWCQITASAGFKHTTAMSFWQWAKCKRPSRQCLQRAACLNARGCNLLQLSGYRGRWLFHEGEQWDKAQTTWNLPLMYGHFFFNLCPTHSTARKQRMEQFCRAVFGETNYALKEGKSLDLWSSVFSSTAAT